MEASRRRRGPARGGARDPARGRPGPRRRAPLTLSVREFDLLVALRAALGTDRVAARSCTRWCGAGALRTDDRSVDVYVHKLRVKLETALPELALHPHPLRASATASRPSLHTLFTTRPQVGNRLAQHPCQPRAR